jgi:exosortase/archaeosortase family protein
MALCRHCIPPFIQVSCRCVLLVQLGSDILQFYNFKLIQLRLTPYFSGASYFIKLIGLFCLLYFGTKFIIGLTVPGGYYSAWVASYLDYPALLRRSLLNGTRFLVGLFGYDTYFRDAYRVNIVHGKGVKMVYSCLGYGLLSFWIAFIVANKGSFKKKAIWLICGCLGIWFINVIRISLVLVLNNHNKDFNLTLDQHTVFNIVVYAFILFMIWLFGRSEKGDG